jgi:DNA-binding NarL/FixJ family response regulator
MGDARFLVLEDEPPIARTLARLVRAYGTPVVAGNVQEGIRALADRGDWSAFIIDVGLPDGSGLDVLAHARPAHPTTPALILTGDTERETINTAFGLGAVYLVKPIDSHAIERFLSGASGAGFSTRAERVVHAWTKRYGLSEAEADVLRRAVLGEDSNTLAAARDSSEETIAEHVASILRLAGDASLPAAVGRVLREVAGAVQGT